MMSDIPVIILAGGYGTRISEESESKPKPMVLIGEQPILWHIMKIYSMQGFNNFIITTGHKHEIIDEWIAKNKSKKSWEFECNAKSVFTGENTQTGGRIRKILDMYSDKTYMITYGDGLANINLNQLVSFHFSHGKIATVTSVRPPARFGHIESINGQVTHFGEKNQVNVGWINGGFFVVNSNVKKYILEDSTPFETDPMEKLVEDGELMTNHHYGFWQPMDTLREKQLLEKYDKEDPKPWFNLKDSASQ
jgi:glucose-1-phosphate cytidylyltransferase